jgi:chaperonin GroES
MATVRPLGDRVLVKVVQRERVTTGGVVLPDNVREESDRGLVLAVGPGVPVEGFPPRVRLSSVDGEAGPAVQPHWGETEMPMRPVPVSEGEVVVFSPYAGSKVAVGKDDYLLLREHDVLGVLDGVTVDTDEATGELRIREVEPALA